MDQHLIQKAWIKQFAPRGTVKVVQCDSLDCREDTADNVGFLPDIQSPESESEDNTTIESSAISALYNLRKNGVDLTDDSRSVVDRWVALHLSRNYRDLGGLQSEGLTYEQAKQALFTDSLKTVSKYDEVWTLNSGASDEPLILSDQPVVIMANQILLPFGPDCIVAFTTSAGPGQFEDRSWNEAMNEMSFQNSNRFVMCHPKKCPDFERLKSRSRDRLLITVETRRLRIP